MIKFQKSKPEQIYAIRSKNTLPLGRTGLDHGKEMSEMWVLLHLHLGGCSIVVFTETLNFTPRIDALYCRHITFKLKSSFKKSSCFALIVKYDTSFFKRNLVLPLRVYVNVWGWWSGFRSFGYWWQNSSCPLQWAAEL